MSFGVVGLVGDIGALFVDDKFWYRVTAITANLTIFGGVFGALKFAGRTRDADDNRVAEAEKATADANLRRVELEAQLAPRALSQEQWELIESMKGKFTTINMAFEADAEAWWFAGHLKNAFLSVGIRGGILSRDPAVHSFGVLIFEPKGFDGGRPRTVGPLVELFKDQQTYGAAAIVTGVPTDLKLWASDTSEGEAPLEKVPMLIIGGRFIVPPSYWPKPTKTNKATTNKTARE